MAKPKLGTVELLVIRAWGRGIRIDIDSHDMNATELIAILNEARETDARHARELEAEREKRFEAATVAYAIRSHLIDFRVPDNLSMSVLCASMLARADKSVDAGRDLGIEKLAEAAVKARESLTERHARELAERDAEMGRLRNELKSALDELGASERLQSSILHPKANTCRVHLEPEPCATCVARGFADPPQATAYVPARFRNIADGLGAPMTRAEEREACRMLVSYAALISSAPPQAKPAVEHDSRNLNCPRNCDAWMAPGPHPCHADHNRCDCGATREEKP